MIDTCELMDMGFVGPRFTWSNMQTGTTCIKERLDRCFCNAIWLRIFLDNLVRHRPRTRSDHHPFFIQSSLPPSTPYAAKLFKILKAWFEHPGFQSMFRRSSIWQSATSFSLCVSFGIEHQFEIVRCLGISLTANITVWHGWWVSNANWVSGGLHFCWSWNTGWG